MKMLIVVVCMFAVRGVCADEVLETRFFSSGTFPNPDPKYRKLGDYIYYAEPQGVSPFQSKALSFGTGSYPSPALVTEIRIAQPGTIPSGTLTLWTFGDGVPGIKLGSVSTPTTFLVGPTDVIGSWDFSSLNIIIEDDSAYWISFDAPMTFYGGLGDFQQALLPSGKWGSIGGMAGAYEIRGNFIPAPSSLAMLGLASVACTTRRRRC